MASPIDICGPLSDRNGGAGSITHGNAGYFPLGRTDFVESRKNLPKKARMTVPVETARRMFDFRAEKVVGKIAPRPLMLLHTADDQVTPTEQSLRMLECAGMPTEIYLVTGESHFPLAGDGKPARDIIQGWLDRFFPLQAVAA